MNELSEDIGVEFRAWDIRNDEMVPDALTLSEIRQLVTVNANFNNPFAFFDGCKWMQYIKKKDINGDKIFEGDILESGSNVVVIKFDEKEGCWKPTALNNSFRDALYSDLSHYKIAGNILANPAFK